MDRLEELFPGLEFEERRPGLYRAEEDTPPDADGIQPPAHWRYTLISGDSAATLIADKQVVRTGMDEDGIVEQLIQYHATGRVS